MFKLEKHEIEFCEALEFLKEFKNYTDNKIYIPGQERKQQVIDAISIIAKNINVNHLVYGYIKIGLVYSMINYLEEAGLTDTKEIFQQLITYYFYICGRNQITRQPDFPINTSAFSELNMYAVVRGLIDSKNFDQTDANTSDKEGNENTMKIVLNRDYGGFRLSDAACAALSERGVTNEEIDRMQSFTSSAKIRSNKHLVEVVELLGDGASRGASKLKVFDLTDLIRVVEEDGLESILVKNHEIII